MKRRRKRGRRSRLDSSFPCKDGLAACRGQAASYKATSEVEVVGCEELGSGNRSRAWNIERLNRSYVSV